ncbi:MAG: hypothetical protein QOG01_3023 [Pseudonocardiales bacterium]|nr:hypothetical protein [Pseudonocardiales bacterium]
MTQPPQGPYYPPQGPPQGPPFQGPPQGPQPGPPPQGSPQGPPGPQQWPPPQPAGPPPQHGQWPPPQQGQRPPPQQWEGQPAGQQQGWPGQYGPQAGPPRIPGPGVGTHLKRAIDWNVAEVVVTPREAHTLTAAGIEQRLQGLFAWRRSSLLVALPFLILSVILSFWDAGHTDTSGLSGIGTLVNWLPSIALAVVPIGALRAITRWTELRRTSKVLVACWLASIVIPLVVALIPLDYLVDLDALRAGDPTGAESTIQGLRLILAIGYALTLLPVVVSVPGGVLKGAARVKSLFPSSSLPGWFLVAVAPFYSMFTIVMFVLIDQLLGNGLLLLGVALLAFGPWLFVIYRKVYARPLSLAEAKTELARASRLGGVFFLSGLFFVVIFLFTQTVSGQDLLGADENKSIFTYVQILETLAEVVSRSIVATVVFCTIFLQMVFADWQSMYGMRADIRREHDTEMMALERYVRGTGPIDPTTGVPNA